MDEQLRKAIEPALHFAAERHRGQTRKCAQPVPYLSHPVQVMRLLWETGCVRDPEILQAALLHDTLEDTATSPDELIALFGSRVAGWVGEVSDDMQLPSAVRKRLQCEGVRALTPAAQLIRLADKWANVADLSTRPPKDWDPARSQAYIGWARSVVDGLRGINPALEAGFDQAAKSFQG